jgi:hypothetical protein
MASQSDGGDGRNRTVGIEAGARLCLVYTIVLRISRELFGSNHFKLSTMNKPCTICILFNCIF